MAEYTSSYTWMKGSIRESNIFALKSGSCYQTMEGWVNTLLYTYDIADPDNVKMDSVSDIEFALDQNGEICYWNVSDNTAIGTLSHSLYGDSGDSYGNKVILDLKFDFSSEEKHSLYLPRD